MEKSKILKTVTVAAVIFIVLLAIALVTNLVKLNRLNARKTELNARIAEVERQIERNDAELERVQSDSYIDRYARELLNMQGKDDEAFTGKA